MLMISGTARASPYGMHWLQTFAPFFICLIHADCLQISHWPLTYMIRFSTPGSFKVSKSFSSHMPSANKFHSTVVIFEPASKSKQCVEPHHRLYYTLSNLRF